ncbi:MAG: pyridoxal-dependent decarboxylase, partial [Bacteroidota bacterium]
AALIGDWLTTAADPNPQDLAGFGDVSAGIERATIDLLLQLFGLPDSFNGGFVTGATMSNFTCLAVARQWAGQQQGYDIAKEGLQKPLHILTATPHSSAIKALAMLGIGSKNIITVATLPGREAMDVADLTTKLGNLPANTPSIVIASGGTVNTVDFDNIEKLVDLKEHYSFWLHIDAAFGGFASLHPDYAHLLASWEFADSITIDNHKWLNVPYDSGCWFVQREYQALQLATFQNSSAPYLGDPTAGFSYLNAGPENSRRLRALPAWFSLLAYGRQGYEDIVARCIDTAQSLKLCLEIHTSLELLGPVHLNVVAFAPKDADVGLVNQLAAVLNARGKYFMTPTTLNGRRGLRAAFVNWQTEPQQVHEIMYELNTALQQARTAPAAAPKKYRP